MIAIIDYDIGNVGAVANMFRRIGVRCTITADPDVVASAARIVLPGNGAFDACMNKLRASGLLPTLERRVLGDRVPLLGICVGAQILGRGSEEGTAPGLGWLEMDILRLPAHASLRVPHMGWDDVRVKKPAHLLAHRVAADARFYFSHSYFMQPAEAADVLLMSSYGIEFAAAVCRDNVAGVQFHPEKSHRFGRELLAAFAGVC